MKLPEREWAPLPQCVEWVVKRTGSQIDQAQESLIGGLRDGRIRSRGWCNLNYPPVTELDHSEWYNPIDWDAKTITDTGADITIEKIELNRIDLLDWLMGRHVGTEVSRLGHKGGRPTKYDWDAVYIEIIKVAIQQGRLPPTRTALVRHVQDWFSEVADEHPAESEIKKRVSRIYKELGLADN